MCQVECVFKRGVRALLPEEVPEEMVPKRQSDWWIAVSIIIVQMVNYLLMGWTRQTFHSERFSILESTSRINWIVNWALPWRSTPVWTVRVPEQPCLKHKPNICLGQRAGSLFGWLVDTWFPKREDLGRNPGVWHEGSMDCKHRPHYTPKTDVLKEHRMCVGVYCIWITQ